MNDDPRQNPAYKLLIHPNGSIEAGHEEVAGVDRTVLRWLNDEEQKALEAAKETGGATFTVVESWAIRLAQERELLATARGILYAVKFDELDEYDHDMINVILNYTKANE